MNIPGAGLHVEESIKYTLWKINMEHTNHPFRKENDLNQTSMIMFQPLIFRGVFGTKKTQDSGCFIGSEKKPEIRDTKSLSKPYGDLGLASSPGD